MPLKYVMLNANKNINPRLFLLDPLSVIVKLAILSGKPVGTKLFINQNIIYFQEPGYFQAVTRLYNTSSKSDLSQLYNPIQIACDQYLDPDNSDDPLKSLFICAYKGLGRLVDTYRDCTILVHTLYFFQSIIKSKIQKVDALPFRNDAITCLYTDELRTRFTNIWTPNKIEAVGQLIKLSEMDNFDESVSENAQFNVIALETAMVQIDNSVRSHITEISQTREDENHGINTHPKPTKSSNSREDASPKGKRLRSSNRLNELETS